MSVYAAAFEIPPGSTLPRPHLERQAITRLVHMIPADVTITGDWTFRYRTHAGNRFWLLCEAPATGPTDPTAIWDLAAFVREDVADMAAWIDYTTRSAA